VGSTFAFVIPLRVIVGAEADVEPRRVVGLAEGQIGPRVLVVDDKEENRFYLANLLSHVGFEVESASNGEDALAIWSVWKPALVLMDLRMPGMDGYEAARRIRNAECRMQNDELKKEDSPSSIHHSSFIIHHSTKIIALSANVLGHDGDAIVAAGYDDFLAKPFREEDLFSRIGALLGVRFRYDEEIEDRKPSGDGSLVPERLAALAPSLVDDLRRAATTGNLSLAYQAVEAVRRSDAPLAEALRGLVKGYRFDELRALIETACRKPTTPGL
jgi:CheY-like chemotaxis protein